MKETDNAEAFIITGTLSVIPAPDPLDGIGNIELTGTIYSDTILSNTIDGDVSIENVFFNDKTITIQETTIPSVPSTSKEKFYINNGLLKSLDSSGKLTTYQPLITKGDFLIHNGTTQVRLPIGKKDQFLIVDPDTTVGVKWVDDNNNSKPVDKLYLKYNNPTKIIQSSINSWISCIYPSSSNCSSCISINSKSSLDNQGVFARLCTNKSLISGNVLTTDWPIYEGITITKEYPENDGMYNINTNEIAKKILVDLVNTTSIEIPAFDTRGAYILSIGSTNTDDNSPNALFILCKSSSSDSVPAKNTMCSAKALYGCAININWGSNSKPTINKTDSFHDGNYTIIDNLSTSNNIENIMLTGTNSTTVSGAIFPYYSNKSFIISIVGISEGYPCAVFLVSKNISSRFSSKLGVRSPGTTTGEMIDVLWDSNSLLKIKKSGNNYDGSYNVIISRLV